jgi:hypothetical protein
LKACSPRRAAEKPLLVTSIGFCRSAAFHSQVNRPN